MKIPSFIKLNNIANNDILNRLYTNLSTIFTSMFSNPILFGEIIRVTLIRNIDQEVTHGLGRSYKGFIPILQDNYGKVKVSQTTNVRTDKTIILQSNQDMIVDLYVF